jgi:hypothetical protein
MRPTNQSIVVALTAISLFLPACATGSPETGEPETGGESQAEAGSDANEAEAGQDGGPEAAPDSGPEAGPTPDSGSEASPPEAGSEAGTPDSGSWEACYWQYPAPPSVALDVGCGFAPIPFQCYYAGMVAASTTRTTVCPTEQLIGCCTYPAGWTGAGSGDQPIILDGGPVTTSWGRCFYSVGDTLAEAEGACPQTNVDGFPTGLMWTTTVPSFVP